ATLFRCGASPVRMPARRAGSFERSYEGFACHPGNAQLVRFWNQLLKNHRAMSQSFSAGEVSFADAVRVDDGFSRVHAHFQRAKKLRYCLAFSLGEELSSCGGIVGDERARHAQTGARCESELSLFVLGIALTDKVVYPTSFVECVEKTFEHGGGLAD